MKADALGLNRYSILKDRSTMASSWVVLPLCKFQLKVTGGKTRDTRQGPVGHKGNEWF